MAFDARVLSGLGVLGAVVDAGSFARAATSLGMTQSGVSRAIARLEDRVGVRLLQRSARAVRLTDEGRIFYDRVAPLITGIEDAASEAGGASAQAKGRLRVVIDAVVARLLVAPRIALFLAANPDLRVDLLVRDQLGDLVAEGFDAAVRFGEPAPSALIVRKLSETRVVTCAAPDYLKRFGTPKHPRDIEDHQCILYRDPTTGQPFEWVFVQGKKVVPVRAQGRLLLNDSATAVAACVAGYGIAQPLGIEVQGLPQGAVTPLLRAWSDERFPLYAYFPSRRNPPAKVRAFIDFIAAGCG